jgi:Zn-dependent protease with chaperone function
MQLAILTAVLASLAAAENGVHPVGGLLWRLVAVFAAAIAPPAVALIGTHRLAPALSHDDASDDAMACMQNILLCIWLGAVAFILLVAQWPQIVRGNWQLAGWPLIDELAILLPVVGPLLLIWAALYRLERAMQVAACQARQVEPPPPYAAAYVWFHVRHHLALVLVPPLAIVTILEICSSLKITGSSLEASAWLVLPLLATTLLLLPVAVRRMWPTRPMAPGELREQLHRIAVERGCPLREPLVWDTNGTMANAAVVGYSRWLRYVLLSDVLLARLRPPEIIAVVKHELAHLRRWHLPLRLALLLLPVSWWLAMKQAYPVTIDQLLAWLTSLGIPESLVSAFGVPVGMLAYAVVAVGWYSRLLEYDADLDACLTPAGGVDPLAAADLHQALSIICGGQSENRWTQWLHPPTGARLMRLRRAIELPQTVGRFRQHVLFIAAAILAAHALAGLIAVL